MGRLCADWHFFLGGTHNTTISERSFDDLFYDHRTILFLAATQLWVLSRSLARSLSLDTEHDVVLATMIAFA